MYNLLMNTSGRTGSSNRGPSGLNFLLAGSYTQGWAKAGRC